MLQRNSSSATASKNQSDSRKPPEGLKSKAELMQSAALDRRLSSNAVHVLAVMLFDLCVTSIGVCRAKQETIAKRIGVSVETVGRAIRELKAAGYLAVEQRYRTSAIYLFVWHRPVKSDGYGAEDPSNLTGQARQNRRGRPVKSDGALRESLDSCPRISEPGEDSRASGAACDDAPRDMFGKEESGRPKKEVSQQASEAFELFWAIYPRRAKKLAARRAWDKAVKTVTAEEIIEGARRYAREREDQPMKYTNHPATWLNGGGWMDDPGANVSHEQGYPEIASELYLRSDEENGLPPGTSEREAAAEHARAQTAWLDDIEARMAGVQR